MNISDVAKKIGLTNKAIHSYEERRLVTPPLWGENGYHAYSQQHLNEPTLLCQARQVGSNLEGYNKLVTLFNDPPRHNVGVKKRMLEKMAGIENHIRELQNTHAHLPALAESCPSDDSAKRPIIDSLSGCCHRRV